MQPIMGLVGNLQFVTTAVVSGLGVANGTISLGAVQAMLQYVRQFGQPMQQLASTSATFQSGLASLERVVELLDQEEITPDPAGTLDPAPVVAASRSRASGSRSDPTAPLIEGLTLTAEPGQTVAIVGPTGRQDHPRQSAAALLQLDAGRITLDGRDIASMPRRELRSAFGMVLQDTWLFGGTILENIRYGDPRATDEDVMNTARVTYVDRMVHSLPDGYQTVINDEGDNVGRPEQLITIALALPRRSGHPDPRRSDLIGRHPHHRC